MKHNSSKNDSSACQNEKERALEPFYVHSAGSVLSTDHGVPIPHTDDSLKAGERGRTLLEDFHLREKMMRFDHERIPERVVHARGSGAHGYFQVYESMSAYTRAPFLCDPSRKTPVFVRFSTVAGSRGSADTVRDVRGFATKFYTYEGNFDLVGNNMPIFFIQDGIKFPDLVHAVKPEPHHEMPQASSAHDNFWDFVSLVPETAHMAMWLMSDRAIPRSYRMMEGFGVHTFRLVNSEGTSHFVKFHWKPLLGVHSLVWDEAQKIAGQDPDFHRRDLWEAIEKGDAVEFELGLQVVEEGDLLIFGFDLLDATKLLPEELVPVRRIGKMTLNRNPQNFFAETEQVAFHVGNVVDGIDFSNDPLMQARLFSYSDTQLTRLGGPNFAQIPINRPIAPVHNHQQDGFMQQSIATGKANYHPNSVGGGCPMLASANIHAFSHFPQALSGQSTRVRSETFQDNFSQATLFFQSQSAPEQDHLIAALRFELSKVESVDIRARVLEMLVQIDATLAQAVAMGIGLTHLLDEVHRPSPAPMNELGPRVTRAPSLSMEHSVHNTIRSRRVAFLASEGVKSRELSTIHDALRQLGAHVEIVSFTVGKIRGDRGERFVVRKTFLTTTSVHFDAVYVAGGAQSVEALAQSREARHFVCEAYSHAKPIGAYSDGIDFLHALDLANIPMADSAQDLVVSHLGFVSARSPESEEAFVLAFAKAIASHRHWDRFVHGQGIVPNE
jgi:catalase